MTVLFSHTIENWASWESIRGKAEAFAPLAEEVFLRHGLAYPGIEKAYHATNAVFKCGAYILKISAPLELEMEDTVGEVEQDTEMGVDLGDMAVELFATKRANELGIASPRLAANGTIADRYHFDYLITEFIDGRDFADAVEKMTAPEKLQFAQALREATDWFNQPCPAFASVRGTDILRDPARSQCWDDFPDSFRAERERWLRTHDYSERVMVHGDMNRGNILLKGEQIYILDFADCVLAPIVYEHAMIAVELFALDPDLLKGFFGSISREALTDICVDGLLIHDFGADLILSNLTDGEKIDHVDQLYRKIFDRLQEFDELIV